MKIKTSILTFLAIVISSSLVGSGTVYGADTLATTNSCIECHKEIHEQVIADFTEDIHSRAGITCSGCHGGNPKIADESSMDIKYGFVGIPKKDQIPSFCGKCHSNPTEMRPYNPSLPTDQVDKYWTSHHGKLLKKQDAKVATCIDCHKTHGILPSNDPRSTVYPSNIPKTCANCHANAEYMAEYGIPTSQYEQYTDSSNVHGYALFVKGDMGAPACNDCHGNHGAAPPGVEHVGQVCTQCHTLNGQLFRESPHKEAFDALEVPECLFCHQASPDLSEPMARIHTIINPPAKLIGTGENAICIQCHSQGDEGWKMAEAVELNLDSLHRRLTRLEDLIETAERQGMEVSDARWKLKSEVLQARMELRTSVHSFNLERYVPVYHRADTSLDNVMVMGEEAMREMSGRRVYFFVMTVLILLLVIALIIKIRNIKPPDSQS